jgi:hypothetical protein
MAGAMTSFGRVYLGMILRPRRTLDELNADPRALRWGATAVAITGALYTLVYFFLAHNGGRPTTFRPWLAIPAEDYYRYNLYLHAPSLLLAWIAASGFAQLAARALGGKGSFEGTLAAFGLALSISTWWTGLHDVVTTFLGYVHVLDQRAYEDALNAATPARTLLLTLMTGYAISFFVLFAKAAAAAHGLRAPAAVATGTLGVVVYHSVFLTFNR